MPVRYPLNRLIPLTAVGCSTPMPNRVPATCRAMMSVSVGNSSRMMSASPVARAYRLRAWKNHSVPSAVW